MTCSFFLIFGYIEQDDGQEWELYDLQKKNIRIDDFQFHEGLYHLYAYYFRVAKFLRQIPSPSTLDLFGAILWCKRWMSWCCSRYVHWLEGRATGGLEMTSVEFSRL